MTELKEKRKTEKLTNEEESLRNLMLEKMHDNGDFERCVCALTEHFDTTQRWLSASSRLDFQTFGY